MRDKQQDIILDLAFMDAAIPIRDERGTMAESFFFPYAELDKRTD